MTLCDRDEYDQKKTHVNQESQITATNPNRVTLVSGSVNVPGSPQTADQGGVYIDNNETPGMYFPLL